MRTKFAALAAACTFALLASAGPAMAHPASTTKNAGHIPGYSTSSQWNHWTHPKGNGQPSPVHEVASSLISPLKVAFGPKGSLLVAESFAGQLSSFSAKGVKSTLVNDPGQEIAGVSYLNGTTYYFNNDQGSGTEPGAENLPARLMKLDSRGGTTQLADLSVFEAAHNPDGATVYGVRNATAQCLQQAPYMQSMGELFSHPYSSAPVAKGVYVGDAGANAILYVSAKGTVRLIKAVPAEAITIDASVVAVANEMGLVIPDCMLGLKYYAQAVPTDIEVSGNWLYYTVLPGVPGESLGVGKAYRMNLSSGKTQLLAQGLAAPTGIAVDGRGTVYVAQLMGEGVTTLKNGKATTVLPAAMTSDVEVNNKTLAALTGALDEVNGGSLVTMRLR